MVVFTHRYNVPHMAFCQGISPIHFLSANVVPMHLHKCQSAPYKLVVGLTLESALSQMIVKPTVITVLNILHITCVINFPYAYLFTVYNINCMPRIYKKTLHVSSTDTAYSYFRVAGLIKKCRKYHHILRLLFSVHFVSISILGWFLCVPC